MNRWFGIRLDASTNITFAGNAVSSNIQSGLNLRNTSDLIVTDTNASSNGGSGIYLNEVSNVTISPLPSPDPEAVEYRRGEGLTYSTPDCHEYPTALGIANLQEPGLH
ncbi:MAG: right-handed parallel beta-helix repeat-containing protein [Candidatus Thermoplasmatota archaeon]|nr:right-handed parallel beta-helix repeat-containing protein [Candidatus Thermoplasmatota archaeon]